MEEPLKAEEMVTEGVVEDQENSLVSKSIGLGICYGSLLGVIGGMIFSNVTFGLSLGAVLGVVVGVVRDEIVKRSKKIS